MLFDLIKAKFKIAFGQQTDLGNPKLVYAKCDCGANVWLKNHVVIFDGNTEEMIVKDYNECYKCGKKVEERKVLKDEEF